MSIILSYIGKLWNKILQYYDEHEQRTVLVWQNGSPTETFYCCDISSYSLIPHLQVIISRISLILSANAKETYRKEITATDESVDIKEDPSPNTAFEIKQMGIKWRSFLPQSYTKFCFSHHTFCIQSAKLSLGKQDASQMEEIKLPSCVSETEITRYWEGSRESPLVSRDKQITLLPFCKSM